MHELKFNEGQKVIVVGNEVGTHRFSIGTVCEVLQAVRESRTGCIEEFPNNYQEYLIADATGVEEPEDWWVTETDIEEVTE